ncbi:MAG: phosphate ABC transporter permease family protein, partial [Pseudomonadales bacterium]|nr:phosphate ABC transporter permease family protein [Pseudomonadales bacterium]
MTLSLLAFLLLGAFVAYWCGYFRSLSVAKRAGGQKNLHSLPGYYGAYTAMWWSVPLLVMLLLWIGFENTVINHLVWSSLPENYQGLSAQQKSLIFNQIKNIDITSIEGNELADELFAAALESHRLKQLASQVLMVVFCLVGFMGLAISWSRIRQEFRARNEVENLIKVFLILSSLVAILTTVGILLSVLFESIRFFQAISPAEFLFGLHWSPQMAIRADQVASQGGFGSIPLFTGTLLISGIAMVIAVPT